MTKKELRKISLQYRTFSSQMLKIDSQEEICYIQMYYDFLNNTPVIQDYIEKCNSSNYNFNETIKNISWSKKFVLPTSQEDLVNFGYHLIEYILDGPKSLFVLGKAYSSSNKFSDCISAFMRKIIEPFVVAIRSYLEILMIDFDNEIENISQEKTIFLSYCQKDADIADLIDERLGAQLKGKATISRDIRDVEYHESFKHFMQSIEKHDFVITLISDSYLKSRNCMYEMLEVVKDSNFSKRLIFFVLCDEDKQYYKDKIDYEIAAKVYTMDGQTGYSIFWKQQVEKLAQQINEIGDPTYAIAQIKEKKIIQKILLDISEFLEFIKDSKGLKFSEHLANDFKDIISYMDF